MGRAQWLNREQQQAWRAFRAVVQLLDDALDRQLQRDARMPHAYYTVLVMLSEAPGRALRMTELARLVNGSQSRMSHAVARLEERGWVRREPCPTDRRGQVAVLTDDGYRVLEAAAPGHVQAVRENLFDQLSTEQVGQLHEICDALLVRLDPEHTAVSGRAHRTRPVGPHRSLS